MSQAESTPQTDLIETTKVVSSEDVLAYLREHPEFLQQHPAALENQLLDHECGGATSLVERQVKQLRQRIQDYAGKLSELLQAARRNDVQFEKTKRLVTQLSGCSTVHDTTAALEHAFINEFHAHAVRLVLLQDHAEQHPSLVIAKADTEQFDLLSLMAEKPWAYCRQVQGAPLADLFANTEESMQSCAILPVHRDDKAMAIIVVASSAADHYTEELDTLFLNHVAAVSSRVLGRICGN